MRLFAFSVPLLLGLCVSLPGQAADDTSLPTSVPIGNLSADFLFRDQMPTGVTVTADGRKFVCYPRWGDHPAYTVAELVDGKETPYPSKTFNTLTIDHPARHLVSVQSVVAPGDGRLWLLDTGTLPAKGYDASGRLAKGAKLVAVDLATNTVERTIVLPESALQPASYLNDVRFDTSKGKAGVAYITDSAFTGPGAIIVVDLASGTARRTLSGADATSAAPGFRPIVEGRYMMQNNGKDAPTVPAIPADGIALSPDGSALYFSALSGRTLYRVPTAALRDHSIDAKALADQVTAIGEKGASDGMIMDRTGRLFVTDYEHNAIHVLDTTTPGTTGWSTLAYDPRLLWPDTLSIGPDGAIYVIANQLHRQAAYRGGHDDRQKPYVLYRIAADAQPIPADHAVDQASDQTPANKPGND